MRRTTDVRGEGADSVSGAYRLRPAPITVLLFLLAFVTATAFLSAAIISVFVIWLPIALLSFAFGARKESETNPHFRLGRRPASL
jgi:hypothetical protein